MKARRSPCVQPLATRPFDLGESARWDGTRLSLVDIHSGDLWVSYDLANHVPAYHIKAPLGAANPAGGDFLLSAADGVARLDAGGQLTWLAHPLATLTPKRRMNDAAFDPAGNLWFGSMDEPGTPGNGNLFRLNVDGSIDTVVDSLGCPNGPTFSADGQVMYLADGTAGTILRCALETPTDMSVFARPPAGMPDGLRVCEDGTLWVALWGAWALARYSPEGQLVELIDMPVRQPTSLCFAAGCAIVTSARHGLDDPAPLDGAVPIFEVP